MSHFSVSQRIKMDYRIYEQLFNVILGMVQKLEQIIQSKQCCDFSAKMQAVC